MSEGAEGEGGAPPRPGPPPLRPMGLQLRADGRFYHEGIPITNPRLHEAFLRGVKFSDEEGVFVVTLRHFRGQLEVEDVPWWVVAYDEQSGEMLLTDGSAERLDPDTLRADPDGALRASVRGGSFEVRFLRGAQEHVFAALEARDGGLWLRVGDAQRRCPSLVPTD